MSLGNVIFHIDVNSAFLSWEAVYRLHHLGWKGDLREQVSAVGGDMAMRHGIILAKSIPAKKYRIQAGESILEAKQKCPNLILVRIMDCMRGVPKLLWEFCKSILPQWNNTR